MDDDLKNLTLDKNIVTKFKKTKNLCLKKTKSIYNSFNLETESFSNFKKPNIMNTQLDSDRKILSYHNSFKQLHTINNKLNKTYDKDINNTKAKEKNNSKIKILGKINL